MPNLGSIAPEAPSFTHHLLGCLALPAPGKSLRSGICHRRWKYKNDSLDACQAQRMPSSENLHAQTKRSRLCRNQKRFQPLNLKTRRKRIETRRRKERGSKISIRSPNKDLWLDKSREPIILLQLFREYAPTPYRATVPCELSSFLLSVTFSMQ